MKKSALALAASSLIAVATPSMATTTIYKTDSQSLSVYGRSEILMIKSGSGTAKEVGDNQNSATVNDSYARIGFKGSTKLTDDFTAFARAGWQVAGQNSDGNKFSARHIYLGIKHKDYGSLLFGQTNTPFYSSLVKAIDFFDVWGMEAQYGLYGKTRQQSQAIYSNTYGPLTFNLGYQFKTENAKDTLGITDVNSDDNVPTQDGAYSAGLIYNVRPHLNLRGAYAYQDFSNGSHKSNYGAGFDYSYKAFYVGFVYEGAQTKNTDSSDNLKANSYDLSAQYSIGKHRFYSGWGIQKQSGAGADYNGTTINSLKVGWEYNFTHNFLSCVEYRHNNGADDDIRGYATNEYALGWLYLF